MSRADILNLHGQNYCPQSDRTNGLLDHGVFDRDVVRSLFPVDPSTGAVSHSLSRLDDTSLTLAERERLFGSLSQLQGDVLPSDLDDATIFSMIPPRYLSSDPVDIDNWRAYLGRIFSEENENLSKIRKAQLNADAGNV